MVLVRAFPKDDVDLYIGHRRTLAIKSNGKTWVTENYILIVLLKKLLFGVCLLNYIRLMLNF